MRTILLLFGIFALATLARAGNTTCISTQLDWYTSAVGETPCQTYERLRQICNKDYQVPIFSKKAPGDHCDDPEPACCCNSVSYTLSMLCLNCQKCKDGRDCIDAIDSAPLFDYLITGGSCMPSARGILDTLDPKVQLAACNKGIRIPEAFYRDYRGSGWLYLEVKESSGVPLLNSTYHVPMHECPIASPINVTPNEDSSRSHGAKVGVIVGCVIGAIFLIILFVVAFLVMRARKLRNKKTILGQSASNHATSLVQALESERAARPPTRSWNTESDFIPYSKEKEAEPSTRTSTEGKLSRYVAPPAIRTDIQPADSQGPASSACSHWSI